MIDYDYSTPASYAGRIARYISDPSTIRARTLDYFGKAPSLEQCRELRKKALPKPDNRKYKTFHCGHDREPMNIIEYSNGREECLCCHSAITAARAADLEAARSRRAKLAEEARIAAQRAKEAARRACIEPIENYGLPAEINAAVANAFGITVGELCGEARAKLYVNARAVAARLHKDNGASYPTIGKRMNRDHSTVINLLVKWDARVKQYPYMLTVYEALRK